MEFFSNPSASTRPVSCSALSGDSGSIPLRCANDRKETKEAKSGREGPIDFRLFCRALVRGSDTANTRLRESHIHHTDPRTGRQHLLHLLKRFSTSYDLTGR